MKRFWQTCLAVVVTAASTSAANAQWNDHPNQIGSYQSILSRAGYGDDGRSNTTSGTRASYSRSQEVPVPPGAQHYAAGSSSVMESGANHGGGMVTSDCGCGGVCDAPNCGGRMGGMMRGRGGMGSMGNCGSGDYLDAGGGCDAPVYDTGSSAGSDANWVVSQFIVNFRRDYEDNVRLGYNGAGTDLYSRDVENGNMVGGGLSFARRNCNGSGFEAVFWALDEEDSLNLPGPTYTYLTGLSNIAHPPSGATVEDIFNAGDNARLFRDTDIFNFELNLLRNGGEYTTRSGRSANYELMGGFRLFKFDESLRYVNYSSTGAYPAVLEYSLEAENSLAGFQLGGRSEICMSDRFRLAYSGSAGIFNNYVETRQQIFDDTGYWAMDYTDTKNDAAFLGQIDLGLIYQFSQKARARVGYRAMGVSGVALAADQIPLDFTNTRALSTANSNGSLLLHGFYYGGEFCF